MPARPRTAALILACAALALAGCSAEEGGTPAAGKPTVPPKVTTTPKLTSANDKGLPLDPYLLDPAEQEKLSSAYRALVGRCMKRFGLTYQAPQLPRQPQSEGPATRVDGRFGPQSASLAARWGYHPPGGPPKQSKGAWASDLQNLPPDYELVLSGSDGRGAEGTKSAVNGQPVPKGGCDQEARQQIAGSTKPRESVDAKIADDLKFATLVKAQQDERTRAVFAKWSACMADRGYQYADPIAVAKDEKWTTTPQPTAQEIQIAVADQDCRTKHNVVGIWFAVDEAYQRQAVEDNAEALAEVLKENESQLKRAADALTG
ncbi:hypothetical protein ACFQLX_10830 [Streptomyces polyrhachis]|uniref:Lipoprotein n=1 Tax=Streptomyces polyrhachis TaxID=1282885 RepID=A0ABW2GG71_9ACTN